MKRVMDLVVVFIALIVAAPLIALSAVGIGLSSPGPIFFRAQRIGRFGTPFTMFKLRTMHHGSGGGPIALSNDPRAFRFGRLLRATRIDELPQLLNVLRGDMAIIGPRPEDPLIVLRAYESWMHEALVVRPGLTSPGTLFALHKGVDPLAPVETYEREVLPKRLTIEIAYTKRATIFSDVIYLIKTAQALVAVLLNLPLPPLRQQEMDALRREAKSP